MKDCDEVVNCSGRREFLVKAAAMAGGLVLTLSGAGSVLGSRFEDVAIPVDANSPLNKVGGFVTVDSPKGKITVARMSETAFVAVSGKCTHKGGPINYDPEAKVFACPWHGSKFGTDGANKGGPASTPLTSYPAKGTATSVTVTVS